MQNTTGMGGSLNLIPFTYRVSLEPIGDQAKYGYLAHVTDRMRAKIMAAGYGEMQLHIEHIKKAVGYIKKVKSKKPGIQLGFDLGE